MPQLLLSREHTTQCATCFDPRRLRFNLLLAESGFSHRTLFLLPGLVTFFTFLKPSPRLSSQLCLCEEIAAGSRESRRARLVDKRFCERRELLGVVGEGLLFFLFLSVTTFPYRRKFLKITPTRRWGRLLGRVDNVTLLSEKWSENRLIILRNTAFSDSKEVVFPGTRADIIFLLVDFVVKKAFLWTVFNLVRSVAA